jgi:hypothetical protein
MRHTFIGSIGLFLAMAVRLTAQNGMLPAPAAPPPVTVVASSAAQSGVRLALVQPPDAPVVIESVAHAGDRLAGTVRLRNRTDSTVSTVAFAFTFGAEPTAGPTFRHVEAVTITLAGQQTSSTDVPGIPLRLLWSLISDDAPVVEIAVVGVRFTSGAAWTAAGHSSWLGRPDVVTPLTCVDDVGQTEAVDALTAITAGASVCQGGAQ